MVNNVNGYYRLQTTPTHESQLFLTYNDPLNGRSVAPIPLPGSAPALPRAVPHNFLEAPLEFWNIKLVRRMCQTTQTLRWSTHAPPMAPRPQVQYRRLGWWRRRRRRRRHVCPVTWHVCPMTWHVCPMTWCRRESPTSTSCGGAIGLSRRRRTLILGGAWGARDSALWSLESSAGSVGIRPRVRRTMSLRLWRAASSRYVCGAGVRGCRRRRA